MSVERRFKREERDDVGSNPPTEYPYESKYNVAEPEPDGELELSTLSLYNKVHTLERLLLFPCDFLFLPFPLLLTLLNAGHSGTHVNTMHTLQCAVYSFFGAMAGAAGVVMKVRSSSPFPLPHPPQDPLTQSAHLKPHW